jgi:hypothetical protein
MASMAMQMLMFDQHTANHVAVSPLVQERFLRTVARALGVHPPDDDDDADEQEEEEEKEAGVAAKPAQRGADAAEAVLDDPVAALDSLRRARACHGVPAPLRTPPCPAAPPALIWPTLPLLRAPWLRCLM